MHYRIKLTDDHGVFWLTDQIRMWSDDANAAFHFTCYENAEQAADMARSRIDHSDDLFARVKIVRFLDS